MSDLDAYRHAQAYPVGLSPAADTRLYTTGILLEIDTATNRAKVSVNGGTGSWVPAVPGVYTDVRTVHVLLDPFQGGRAQLVIGPCEDPVASPDPLPQPAPAPAPDEVSRSVTVTPTWSGTWRVSRAAWDRWNTGTYGGRSDVYQGSGYGSGTLIGLVTYGDQIANLGAVSISSAVLTVVRNGSGAGEVAATVQGSPHGSQPAGTPTGSGSTAMTVALPFNGRTTLALPSDMRTALRTGAAKGLLLVGATYAGFRGTSLGDGMALALTYTAPS